MGREEDELVADARGCCLSARCVALESLWRALSDSENMRIGYKRWRRLVRFCGGWIDGKPYHQSHKAGRIKAPIYTDERQGTPNEKAQIPRSCGSLRTSQDDSGEYLSRAHFLRGGAFHVHSGGKPGRRVFYSLEKYHKI